MNGWLRLQFGCCLSANAVGAALRRHVRWVICRQGGVHISYLVVTENKGPRCLQAACPLNVQSARIREIRSKRLTKALHPACATVRSTCHVGLPALLFTSKQAGLTAALLWSV